MSCVWKPAETRYPGPEVPGSFEPPGLEAGTWVFWKSNEHSGQLSHPSNPNFNASGSSHADSVVPHCGFLLCFLMWDLRFVTSPHDASEHIFSFHAQWYWPELNFTVGALERLCSYSTLYDVSTVGDKVPTLPPHCTMFLP